MTILILYTRNQGYLSKFFEEVSLNLSREGHKVYNFSLKSRKLENEREGVSLKVEKKGGYLRNYYHICKYIKFIKPDLILSNFSYVNPALLFGKVFKVKKNIVWFHSLNAQTQATSLNISIKRFFLRLADVVVANSHHTKDELFSEFKVPKTKIATIPFWSPISYNQLFNHKKHENNGTLLIGCPGRLVEHKNQGVILEALSTTTIRDFHLHFAGIGPLKDNLQAKSKELRLDSQVTFRGHLSAKEMVSFYETMDLIILPSLSEAFGLVFLEAIKLGTPVLVSETFGALTFIEKNERLNSIIFNPSSSEDLKTKIEPYLKREGLHSEYFTDLYHNNFNKSLIYNRIKEVMID